MKRLAGGALAAAVVAGVAKLRGWNRALDRFSVRTTGSPNHVR